MGLTSAQLKEKIVANLATYSHTRTTHTPEDTTGDGEMDSVDTTTDSVAIVLEEDMDPIVTSICDAIISEILSKGIDIGDSTSTKMDVG